MPLKSQKNPKKNERSKNYKRVRRNKNYFGGLMWEVMKRDQMRCQKCGLDCSKNFLYNIHHKDGDNKNNSLGNLVLLCVPCHAKERDFICVDCGIKSKAKSARQKRCVDCGKVADRKQNNKSVAEFLKRNPDYWKRYKKKKMVQ